MDEGDDCIVIDSDNGTSSTSSLSSSQRQHQHHQSINGHPSRLAEIIAHKVKIKQEKIHSSSHAMMMIPPIISQNNSNIQHYLLQQQQQQQQQLQQQSMSKSEIELLPRTNYEIQIVSQLRQMGFNNNDREIMVALRAIEKKRNISLSEQQHEIMDVNSIIDDIMLYIVTQREEQNEARKMDIAREQSEANVVQEQMMHKTTMNLIYQSLSTDELLGSCKCTTNDDPPISSPQSQSLYFPSSNILKSKQAKEQLKKMIQCDDTNHTARMKIINLLTLESKAYKWFGDKIPYAYFGIQLPNTITGWDAKAKNSTNGTCPIHRQLTDEINTIENAMYCLSEQVEGDLGLMIPKKFIEARNDAISKGLIEDETKKNDIIVLDDD